MVFPVTIYKRKGFWDTGKQVAVLERIGEVIYRILHGKIVDSVMHIFKLCFHISIWTIKDYNFCEIVLNKDLFLILSPLS